MTNTTQGELEAILSGQGAGKHASTFECADGNSTADSYEDLLGRNNDEQREKELEQSREEDGLLTF